MLSLYTTVLVCFIILSSAEARFHYPEVRIHAYHPKGFHVSIRDQEGISLFAFHGKVNEEILNREAGDFSVDITRPKHGRWTYVNRHKKLKINDVLYYWVNVDYDDGNGKRGYILDDQEFRVKKLIVTEDDIITTTTERPVVTTTTKKPTTTNPCKDSPTLINGRASCKGKLIFEENFDQLLTPKWEREVQFASEPDFDFVIYESDPDNLYLSNSKLHIKPSLTERKYGTGFVSNRTGLNLGEACTGSRDSRECVQKAISWSILPPVISGQVSTKDHFSFLYGIIEIRARFPKGDWVYPELFLRSKNDDYGPGLESGLIRIAFTPGNAALSNNLYGGCVLGYSNSARSNEIKRRQHLEKHWTDEFHVYKVEWRPDRITFLVDGSEYGNITPPSGGFVTNATDYELREETQYLWQEGSPLAPFDKEMYIILGVGVGGQIFTDQIENQPWDNDDPKGQLHFYRAQDTWSKTWNNQSVLVVDYVKVWAL